MDKRRGYDPNPYYDPDPIAISTIIGILIICGAIGGASVAIQRPAFFDHLIMLFKPDLLELAEEEAKATREFWRIILIIALAVLLLAGLLLAYRFYEKKQKWRRR